jgi:hypothetical protein
MQGIMLSNRKKNAVGLNVRSVNCGGIKMEQFLQNLQRLWIKKRSIGLEKYDDQVICLCVALLGVPSSATLD